MMMIVMMVMMTMAVMMVMVMAVMMMMMIMTSNVQHCVQHVQPVVAKALADFALSNFMKDYHDDHLNETDEDYVDVH